MRVDVQLDDSELALLAGYNRSTTMGIKKPGELQRELLSNMENLEEKRMSMVPEEPKSAAGKVAEGEDKNKGADEGQAEEVKSTTEDEGNSTSARVRSDFLSMLSEMAQRNTNEDSEGSKDSEGEGEDSGILPADDEYDWQSEILPADDDEDSEGDDILPPDDEDEDNGDDDEVLPEDDEYEDDGILPPDDEDVASEDASAGIIDDDFGAQQDEDDGYFSELPEDEDDGEYSSELPEDEEEDSSVLPDDEDEEEDSSVLPDDEDGEEVEDEAPSAGIPETRQESVIPDVVEKPVLHTHKVQKSKKPAVHHQSPRPSGYSAPSVPLYDFILNNGGSMLIEDVRKYYPIDEVKKALSLGKIYRFGNHVGV